MATIKEITIYDIARKLQISASTVSRALQDHPAINKKTKKKVFDTAARMGYRSNLFARSLRSKNTMTIGVIVADLNSGVATSILSGIEKVANEAGYGIVITDSSQSAEKELANARNLFHRRVDGLIVSLASNTHGLDHFKSFIEKGIPVIFIDRAGQHKKSMSVMIDNTAAGYMATRHLAEQGCKRIAHITPGVKQNVYSLRYKGYLEALRDSKLAADKKWLVISDMTEEASAEAAKKIMGLKPMPDGLFVPDDLAAAVCIRTFMDAGVRVPADIAVVGFNNDTIGKLIKPSLTTISYPGTEIGETAARQLVYHLKGLENIEKTSAVTIRSELIVRQSSLKKTGTR